MYYFLGVISGILSGFANFFGQILQKKAINDIKRQKGKMTLLDLVKNPTWLIGFGFIIVLSTLFLVICQIWVGPALVPGLVASGFIVLAIGSAKILGEKLNKEEYLAIGMLILAVICLSFSGLSIEGDTKLFSNEPFVNRIGIVSGLFIAIWLYLYYTGKKSTKKKAILISLGAGFPFIVGNLWMQPFILTVGDLFAGALNPLTIRLLLVSTTVVAVTNIGGMIHTQTAMAAGNASIVIPIMQIPQQLSPIAIYFIVYALAAPALYSYFLLAIAMGLAIYAGFLLTRRQTELEKLIADEATLLASETAEIQEIIEKEEIAEIIEKEEVAETVEKDEIAETVEK